MLCFFYNAIIFFFFTTNLSVHHLSLRAILATASAVQCKARDTIMEEGNSLKRLYSACWLVLLPLIVYNCCQSHNIEIRESPLNLYKDNGDKYHNPLVKPVMAQRCILHFMIWLSARFLLYTGPKNQTGEQSTVT